MTDLAIPQPTTQPVLVTARFTASAFALRQALARLKPAVATRGGALPILSGVRVDVRNGVVILTCSDLDLTLTTAIEASRFHPGSFVAPFKLLANLVSKATAKTDVDITVTLDTDDQVSVTRGPMTVTLRLLPLDEWPRNVLDTFDGHDTVVDVDALGELAPAASKDDARPILTAVYVNGTEMVATDSYRLAIVADLPDTGVKALLPARVGALLGKYGGQVPARFGDRYAAFTTRDVTMVTRLVEGDFPHYQGLIPSSTPYQLETSPAQMRDAVVDILGSGVLDGCTPVRVAQVEPGVCNLVAITQDVGEAHRQFNGQMTGDYTLAFNPHYLKDMLDLPSDDTVQVGYVDALKPVIVRQERAGGGQRIRLLMPVRVT